MARTATGILASHRGRQIINFRTLAARSIGTRFFVPHLALYFASVWTKPWPVNDEQTPSALPPSVPPPLLPEPPGALAGAPTFRRKLLGFLLSIFLVLLVASGAASVMDDSCAGLWGIHLLGFLSGSLSCLTVLAAVIVFGLMALTPMVPKRVFLPAVLVIAGQILLALPLLIFFYHRALLIDWLLSWMLMVSGLVILRLLQGTWKFRWPLVADRHLGGRAFSWGNLLLFVLLNLLVLLPALVAYVAGCAGLAVSHFTDGFVSLRPAGIIMQARKYVRDDGRSVVLFPMSHIAESDFYQSVAGSATSNSVVLLEGVTDVQNLLTNKLSYRRAAKALHLAEQHDDFELKRGQLVRADVDVQNFSSNTIAVLNLVARIHSEGLNARNLLLLLQFSPSEDVQQQLLNDLLLKRNQHVLHEFFARLPQSDSFIIPWGAAHMSGLAQEIQKAGFHLVGTHDYVSIRFGAKKANENDGVGWVTQAIGSP
ncbi:MAG: hypothetical protein ABSH48_05570 [Verrucomicrobiota bacterium]|jgi:hypothetical protein